MKPTLAIIGASADRTKYSNKSLLAHHQAGYEIYPINPKEVTIEGLQCYKSILKFRACGLPGFRLFY